MELRRTETGFALYKEKEVIGHCTLHPVAQGAALAVHGWPGTPAGVSAGAGPVRPAVTAHSDP